MGLCTECMSSVMQMALSDFVCPAVVYAIWSLHFKRWIGFAPLALQHSEITVYITDTLGL